jgi:hypothetical protein
MAKPKNQKKKKKVKKIAYFETVWGPPNGPRIEPKT